MEDNSLQYCWQYKIRLQNLPQDLEIAKLTHAKISTLRICDFKFEYVPKENRERCREIKDFIVKHEWPGKMPHRPTHRFIATYNGHLAGVVVMATPNAFSHLLGKDNRNREKLISRGACISWSPKNLASALLMFSIRWMVNKTPYRLFSGYSDTTAGELGTIYQACNFTYLGQLSGDRFQYFDPRNPEKGWFSERLFRKTGHFKKHAANLGIRWQRHWHFRDKILWDKIPWPVAIRLKEQVRAEQANSHRKRIPRKHKYIYIVAANKRETKKLRKLFAELNPTLLNIPYPKERFTSLNTAIQIKRN